MTNIHDNEIVSYTVDLKNQKIIFYTEYLRNELTENIQVVFNDVLAHFFENEMNGSAIYDIEKCSVSEFINDNSRILEQRKNYCWPIDYDTIEELTEKLLKGQYFYYIISSSYGLNGWILAKNYQVVSSN